MLGCTNPAAKNYNPAADEDNGTCIYLSKVGGNCIQFNDVNYVTEVVDQSFTLSYDTVDNYWTFFHDYWPDYYIHTRKNLYTLKNNKIFQHNRGTRGVYHTATPKPFMIDVLFANKETLVLNSVNWVSEVRAGGNREADENSTALYNETISAITIWNQYYCTGRIPLSDINLELLNHNSRNSEQNWNFNDFKNIAKDDSQFLDTLFNDFKIIEEGIDRGRPWYKDALIEGKYFIVRFEFINTGDKQITLHDVDIDADVSLRG
jgi:hypothetical protein